ncbi:acetolactate synthase large subunit [Pauljensenia sp. UMB1235]|uniref:acetolactate synthase large subunit n=1 Tax=unclassified Pauljensenia TaxID=2908895 RepID=UPI00254DA4F3|nr:MULTISPECIES: acetolactate synthase large subunit [unclassified Pauljensenia]MDK6401016.1 acetolactate synthase large subunit [Pauljensenia sp. UMB9872]MDK7173594.1 acetolactate synthase large subunit [Pauljensenia sp. UMB1235]
MTDTAPTQTMTGAQAIIASLEALGVTDVFGMPGGAILPTYDPLMSSKLNHILVRHEQGAGHAAEGYALATGKVGCAIVTSGPGATNTLTALADANMDSVPMVVISGQVGASLIGTDAFQEADIVGASMPLTKHAFLVTDATEIPSRLAEAFEIASTGRPGPVLVDVTKSAQTAQMNFSWPPAMDLPGYKEAAKPHKRQVRQAAEAILQAQAPVLYVGGGMIRSGATDDLARLVEATDAPVVTTLTARGAFPDSDSHTLGMPGMHGTVAAVGALQRSDLIVTLGARFDDRVTGNLDSFAPRAKIVHIDIDAAEISKNRFADIPIVGNLADALPMLVDEIVAMKKKDQGEDISGWWRYLNRLKDRYPMGWTKTEDGMMAPQEVLSRLSKIVGPDAIYVTGVGQHQMWSAQFIQSDKPRHFISSSGLGTMGFSIPAAMGAQVGKPNNVVWAIDGDGSFQMTNQELATCTVNNIPIKVCLINNSVLGMVRQWQSLFYDKRYSNTTLNPVDGEQIPNFEMLATAYGMAARTVRSIDEVDEAIEWAMSINDRPVLIDFRVSKDSMVWPMVAAGVSNDEIRYAKGMAPDWDVED